MTPLRKAQPTFSEFLLGSPESAHSPVEISARTPECWTATNSKAASLNQVIRRRLPVRPMVHNRSTADATVKRIHQELGGRAPKPGVRGGRL